MPRRKREEVEYRYSPAAGRRAGSYPLTIPEWIDMYQDQDGKCRLCDTPMLAMELCVMDHNHITAKVRALLCNGCNVKISYLCDDLERLQKMNEYAKLGFWADDPE